MRSIASGLLTALRGEHADLVTLVEIVTGGASSTTIYLTPRAEPVTWNGHVYAVRAMGLGDEIRAQGHGEVGRLQIHVANADRYFQGLISAGAAFERQRVTIRLTEQSRLAASPVEATSTVCYVEAWTFTEGLFTLELLSRSALMKLQIPRGILSRAEFPGLPRDASGL